MRGASILSLLLAAIISVINISIDDYKTFSEFSSQFTINISPVIEPVSRAGFVIIASAVSSRLDWPPTPRSAFCYGHAHSAGHLLASYWLLMSP